jgi:hypothetical protein
MLESLPFGERVGYPAVARSSSRKQKMFTIKVYKGTGHYVRECRGYAFHKGEMEGDIALQIDTIVYDDGTDEGNTIPVGSDSIYIMNSAGKTIDSFHMYTPDNPKRLALEPKLRGPDYDARWDAAQAAVAARYSNAPPV